MSDHLPTNPPAHLACGTLRVTPVTEAAALLGSSPALFTALIEGGIIEGALIDGVWHVDTAVLAVST